MEYGCIAERLGHSFSKVIHARLADYSYDLCELAPNELDDFFAKRDFLGINVTIPYKERVIPYLYELDEQAQAIGAVNTIVNRNGCLYGYNTDFYGMTALLARIGIDPKGKKVAVLGTGGTSRTACAVAESLGAKDILRVSRKEGNGAISYETLISAHTDVRMIINTTPLGMYPNPDGMAVSLEPFRSLEGVADAVYNPLRSKLILEAKKRGIPAEGGLFMLVAQAVRASEIFLDVTYPKGTLEHVFRTVEQEKENIVLCGMPGSGKSTVGAILAKKMKRPFFDLDECIVRTSGKSIPQIFADEGEAAFRDLETRVLKEMISQENGAVIATGGGAILRDENVDALRRNGRLYFLDRPLEELIPTEDRPLSSNNEALRKRFEERYFRYCSVADCHIEVRGDAQSVALDVGKDFENV